MNNYTTNHSNSIFAPAFYSYDKNIKLYSTRISLKRPVEVMHGGNKILTKYYVDNNNHNLCLKCKIIYIITSLLHGILELALPFLIAYILFKKGLDGWAAGLIIFYIMGGHLIIFHIVKHLISLIRKFFKCDPDIDYY